MQKVQKINNTSTYSYELQLLDIDPNEVEEGSIGIVNSSISYFSSGLTDYEKYIELKKSGGIYATGNNDSANVSVGSASNFRNTSLKSSNFDFDVSGIYLKGGIYRTKVTISYYNVNGVSPQYSSKLGRNVYFVPIKFDVSYVNSDDCIRDTAENASKYPNYGMSDKKTEYYWMHRTPEYKWSTQTELEGYEYTGIWEYR